MAQRIDAACDQFESEWKAGRRPRVEDYLNRALPSDRESLRQALLGLEQELKGKAAAETAGPRDSVRTVDRQGAVATAHYQPGPEDLATQVGRFQVRDVLGSGSFGKVYRAFDPQLGREVALKVPVEASVRTEAERAQFLKEARAAATINHPNICQIHEVGEHQGRPYIVMALVPGHSLADMLKNRKEPMPEKQAAQIVRKVALALAAAHDKGIVHRDLKPANIMIDRERKDVVVMDFGMARAPRFGDARATQSGVIMGTPAYMSPEQARGDSKDVGPRGDVFSLGVIFYELLTNTRPFSGTASEVIGQILHVNVEPPAKRRPGLDPRLEAACLKAMAKDPAARFGSMKEFAGAVDIVLRSAPPATETVKAQTTRRDASPIVAPAVAGSSPSSPQKNGSRWMLILLTLMVLAILGIVGGLMFMTRGDTVNVRIELTDVDIHDTTLRFTLDDTPISAKALTAPIDLKPGEHTLIVRRDEVIVKHAVFVVTGGSSPGIAMKPLPPVLKGKEDPGKTAKDKTPVSDGWKGFELVHTLPHKSTVSDACFSADGKKLYTSSYMGLPLEPEGPGVHVWDTTTWKLIGEPARVPNCSHIALKGDVMVFGVNGNSGLGVPSRAEIVVWDLVNWKKKTTFAFDGDRAGWLTSLDIMPDSKSVLASLLEGHYKWTAIFDLALGEYRQKVKGYCSCSANDGKTFLVGDGMDLKQVEIANGKVTRTFTKHASEITFVACSPDGRFAATCSREPDKQLILWDLTASDGAPVLLSEQKSHFYRLAFSPNSKNLVSGSSEGVMKLWDVIERKEIAAVRADEKWVWSVRFSPDGTQVVSGGNDEKAAKVWKLTK